MKTVLLKFFQTIYVLALLTACMQSPSISDTGKIQAEASQRPSSHTNNEEATATITQAKKVIIQTKAQASNIENGIFKQIWQVNSDDLKYKLLYESRFLSDIPISEIFSEQELSAFTEWFNTKPEGIYPPPNEIYPTMDIQQLVLSGDGQNLAWIELISWSPAESTTIFGMNRIVLLDLTTGDKKILYEIELHPNGWTGGEIYLAELTWSFDGQKIAFVQGSLGAYQARTIDPVSGTIQVVGMSGESGLNLAWSPDGNLLVTNTSDTLNVLSTEAGLVKKVAGWGNINGIDWSPRGEIFIFAGSKDSFPERLDIYTLDIDTEILTEIEVDKNASYEDPKWSPDGMLIGFNSRSKRLEPVDKFLIYDPSKREIVATFEGKRSDQKFFWTDDGQSILLTQGYPPDTPRAIVLFHWQENRTEIIPFPEGIDDGIAIGILPE